MPWSMHHDENWYMSNPGTTDQSLTAESKSTAHDYHLHHMDRTDYDPQIASPTLLYQSYLSTMYRHTSRHNLHGVTSDTITAEIVRSMAMLQHVVRSVYHDCIMDLESIIELILRCHDQSHLRIHVFM